MRLIDINIVSGYMGRFLTLIVTVLVLAITLSALIGLDGVADHSPIAMEVPQSGNAVGYEALGSLITRITGRPVSIGHRDGGWNEGYDLYIFSTSEYMENAAAHSLEPLYAFCPMKRRSDAALLIARPGANPAETPAAKDVLFTSPASINGCWLQLAFLEPDGEDESGGLEALRFAGPPGGGSRVVWAVLFGDAEVGACRRSDLRSLIDGGVIGEDELHVLESIPALPETLVACRPGDADYFRGVFDAVATHISAPGDGSRARRPVEILASRGVRNLRPVSKEDLERIIEVFEFIEARTGG